ncbi:MAG: DUF362 domain-containing protein [Desulfovibrio alaskensis]|nr:DUF362 domain-containing protein [Oleidesulfovibrio alaskensis]
MRRHDSMTFSAKNAAGETTGGVFTVALDRCAVYGRASSGAVCGSLLESAGWRPAAGSRVLVKPNLLRAQPDGLCCTHPQVVRAAVEYALDCGAVVTVGDSPAFGSAERVAQAVGLTDALQGLGVRVVTLDDPVDCRLPSGLRVGVARAALEADALLNVPRVKVHCQMRLTLAVKNLFGCVCGVRKAVAHTRHGDRGNRFEALIVELAERLPPSGVLLDGITAMHRTGPSGGDPYLLGLLGASCSSVAMDTAVGTLLGAAPETIPLWAELRRRKQPAAFVENLHFPVLFPADFSPQGVTPDGFCIPQVLKPVSFRPATLLRSLVRRMWHRYGPSA